MTDTRRVHRRHVVAIVAIFGLLGAACGSGSSLESQSWRFFATSGNDLVLEVQHGACDRFVRADLVETATEVQIDIVHRVDHVDCDAVELIDRRTVTLQHPLGTRCLRGSMPTGAQACAEPTQTPDANPVRR